ncbi:MAG: tyrosine-type recombinase/integrase [Velocimicrobium sp.]
MGKALNGTDLGVGISQRQDGRYIARYTNKLGKRKTFYSFKLKDIKKNLRDAKYEDEHGLNGNGIDLSLNKWFETWLELYKRNNLKSTSLYKIRSYHQCRVSPVLGEMNLKDIRLVHVQKFINDLFEDGLSYGSVANIKFQLSDMFNKAILNEYIVKNPCDGLEMPKKVKVERRVLTIDEQKRFFEFAETYIHINVLKFAVLTGARIGEVLGLKWSDVDFGNKTITIDKTIHYSKAASPNEGSKFFYTSTKTTASQRTLPMTEEVISVLKSQKIKQFQEKMFRGKNWKQVKEFENLVFTQNDGKPIYYYNVEDAIKTYVEKLNVIEIALAKEEKREPIIIESFTCHTLRHTYATRCYEQNIPDKVIQALLGHSKLETTMDTYTHVTEETMKDEVSKLKILA